MRAELREIAALIVRDAVPATAGGGTSFVPRYQLDRLREALKVQPAPEQPAAHGWRCEQCGELADPMSSGWRWTGDRWQHHHGPVGHVDARHFGEPAAQGDDYKFANTPAPDGYYHYPSPEGHTHRLPQSAPQKLRDDFDKGLAAIAAFQRQPADADRVDAFVRAFVAGAKWWEFEKTGATMWQSDQDRAAAAARWKLDNPAPQPPEDDAAIDSVRAEGGGRER